MASQRIYLMMLVLITGLVQTGLSSGLDPDLVAWWKFDDGDGGIALDSGVNALHGDLIDGPQWRTDGYRNGCLFFDGANDYVRVPDQDTLNPNDDSFTFVVWSYIEEQTGASGSTNWDLPVAKRNGGSNGYYVGADRTQGQGDETGYRFMLGDTNSNRKDTPYLSIPLGEWTFVAAVLDRDTDTQKISVDGGQTWATTTPPPGAIAPPTDLGLGWDINQNNYWFHGMIDEVAMFRRALSDAQVARVMQYGVAPGEATVSSPLDAATDVARDAPLTWTPGLYAATHDVYFGTGFDAVSTANRDTPLDVLVSEGQDANSYDPGRLAFGQTYYWRIDEVNAAPNSAIFTGNVWTFTAEPLAYPIESVTAVTNGVYEDGIELVNTINGSGLDADDAHSIESSDMWSAVPPEGEDLYVEYTFDRAYKLHAMQVWNYNVNLEHYVGFGFQDVTVEYTANGADWTVLADMPFTQATGTVDYTANTTVDFEGHAVQGVRLTVHSNFGTADRYGLSEVRFLYIPVEPTDPTPANGATEVHTETPLQWRAGREAAAHEVYLGLDPEALAPTETVSANTYQTDDFELGTTYYWQIVEVNEAEAIPSWTGEIWSFSTLEYISVEDFEGYGLDSPNLIFQSWIDGWGFEEDDFFPNGNNGNGSGAQVGYLDAPYTEQAIVHGGSQSMPLIYDNTEVSYAEAERTFDTSQDWTTNGIGTLTVFFRGMPDNTGNLYLKVNNTKIAYNGNANAITKVTWQTWNIDLATVGTSLTNVRTLAIGIDGDGATGTLYVDDIRLYRVAPKVATEPDNSHLIAYYAFDGNVTDGSGNNFDGQIGGEPVYVDGAKGQALEFDGEDDYVGVANDDRLNPGDGSFSITFWARLDPKAGTSGTTTWDMVIGKRGSSGSIGYYVGAYRSVGDSDQAGYKFMLGNTSATRVDTPFLTVPTDEWVFVAAVLDREQNIHKISVNGGSSWAEAAPPTGTISLTADLGIGWDIGQNNYWFHGIIDEVRFYDVALANGEVTWLAGN